MALLMTHQSYRHKKFDVTRQRQPSRHVSLSPSSLKLKQELLNLDTIDVTRQRQPSQHVSLSPSSLKLKQELLNLDTIDVTRQRQPSQNLSLSPSSMKLRQELLNLDTSEETSTCSSDYSAIFQLKRTSESAVLASSTPVAKRRRLGDDSGLGHADWTTDSSNSKCESNESSSSGSSSIGQLPQITAATLRDICKYHGNMVRNFPKRERTPKDQERRDKNTIACRMSRRVKKLEHLAIEEQYKEFSAQHFRIVEQSMRATAYLNHLNQLKAKEQSKKVATPTKNFTIDYLMSEH